MSTERPSRGIALPGIGPVLMIAAALCGGWLLWTEFGKRGWIPGVARAVDDPVNRIQTVEALIKRGHESVPVLVAALGDADPKIRRSALLGLGRIGPEAAEALPLVRGALTDQDFGVRSEAATAFVRITRDPELTSSNLARLLADPNESVRDTAAVILEKIGTGAMGPVVEILHGDLSFDRSRALQVLRRLLASNSWPDDPDHAGSLLSDGDRDIRLEALRVFSRRGRSAAHINAVSPLLDDPDQDVRQSALTAIVGWGAGTNEQIRELLKTEAGVETALSAVARRGPEAAELVPDIVAVLEKQEQVKTASNGGSAGGTVELRPPLEVTLAALTSLKTAASPAAPLLISRLGGLHAGTRMMILATLVDIGAPADDLMPFLIPLLTEGASDVPTAARHWPPWDDREIIHQAGIVLRRASLEEARRQAALLIPRLRTADGKIDKKALYALWGLGPAASEAVPELVSLVPNPDGAVFWHAVVTLGEIGPEAAPAVPAFVAAVEAGSRETDGEICDRIIEVLGKIGPSAKSAVPLLLRVIDEPEQFVLPDAHNNVPWARMFRGMSISSVGQIDDGSPDVLASLRALIASGPDDTRMAAVKALANMTERAPQVLADLVALLRSDNASARGQAALAIGKLSLDRTAAIQPLLENLAVENPYLRAASAVALGQIGPDARAALPILREMLSDPKCALPVCAIRPPGWENRMPSYVQIPEIHNLTLEQAAREAIARIEH